jgi:hypothetical protein
VSFQNTNNVYYDGLQDNLCVHFVVNIREGQESSAFEFEISIEKLEMHKSPYIGQIPEELIKQGLG